MSWDLAVGLTFLTLGLVSSLVLVCRDLRRQHDGGGRW